MNTAMLVKFNRQNGPRSVCANGKLLLAAVEFHRHHLHPLCRPGRPGGRRFRSSQYTTTPVDSITLNLQKRLQLRAELLRTTNFNAPVLVLLYVVGFYAMH